MNNLKSRLTCIGIALMLAAVPKLTFGQSQTPVLESINLPFNIDGYVERQSSSYGDWTKGSQTNGIDSGSVFNINGNTKNVPLTYHFRDLFDTPGSGTDDVFDGGNKANDNPTSWSWKLGSALDKVEMNNANLHFSNDTATGDLWAVMASDRSSTNGTGYLDFEFYQKAITTNAPTSSSNGSFSTTGTDCGRTVGDLLITVEYSNGGLVDSIYFYKWASSSGSSCGYDWVGFTIASGNAFGSSNSSSINVPYSGFGSTTYTNKQFVEIAVNITDLVDSSLTSSTACTGLAFESVFIKSKSSNSPTADLKDMIAPIQLELNLGVAKISYPEPICSGGGVYSPSKSGPPSTDGGTYSLTAIGTATGASINTSSGDVTIASNADGSFQVVYAYSPRTGCTKYDTAEINVGHRISGNLFNDNNGFVDNTVNGTGFNSADGNQIYAVLVNNSGEVIENATVAPDGTYEFSCGPNGTYSVLIKTSEPNIGSTGNSSDLPTNWAFTAEKLGSGTGSDGTPNGELTVITVNGSHVGNANFGINKRPDAISYNHNILKPIDGQEIIAGYDASVISSSNLRGEDNEDGTPFTLSKIEITSLPSNDSNEVWYNGTQITKGDDGVNPPSASNPYTITSFDNTLLSFKIYCCEEATLYYSVFDAANLRDESPAFYRYAWAGAVPVEFTRVSATLMDVNNVRVNWTTATEINNERFEIERLVTGEDEFIKVGEVDGSGNSTSSIDYQFMDYSLKSVGNVLYRVKQIDYDGQFDYSDVVKVNVISELDVSVYPNPAREYFVVRAGNIYEELSIELMDMRGSVLEKWTGVSKLKASTEGLQPGIYSLRIRGDYSVKTIVLQVQ
ncbi:MAG: T9SS type A sorting domain-containing protein [Bacteroidia bacterium]|nr:T9SS type A sorting domain-containing protein [Bacteroidia bacterium]NNJ56186.1 T9SS type A sorting domain-containing protein [Bacteroidia bacterium]